MNKEELNYFSNPNGAANNKYLLYDQSDRNHLKDN